MKIAFYTLGCKVNQYETQLLQQTFSQEGYEIVDASSPADVYVVNSCTVTAAGDKKTRQILRRIKKTCPDALTVLTGCFPQAFPQQAQQITEADVITGNANKLELPQDIRTALLTGERVIRIPPHDGDSPEQKRLKTLACDNFGSKTRAFLKIEDGCERYCSYCIIPLARGPVVSKPLEQVRQEAQALADKGYQEIVLVGINLSCYGQDLGLRLLDAVQAVCAVDGIRRVRLGSLEPELLSDADILLMTREDKLCPQFHLSLQSGCDTTLRRMNRRYSAADYAQLVRMLRERFPGCAITTDVMVGFPGETEKEFAASLKFIQEMAFARTHVFSYSPRPGTVAAGRPGQIPVRVKEERSRQMLKAAAHGQAEYVAAQLHRTVPVLFETKTPRGYEGYTPEYVRTYVRSDNDLRGRICAVEVTGSMVVQNEPCLTGILKEC